MSKKKRQITDFQFKVGLVVGTLLVVALLYFAFIQDRFTVREDGIGQEPLIKDHLSYETEFCANRLTELAHEVHFLEKEITSEKEMLGEEELIQKQEEKVITNEQWELQEIKDEFEVYTSKCG